MFRFRLWQGFTVLVLMLTTSLGFAQSKAPRVLFLVTSADHFANGERTGLWVEEFAVPYQALTQAGIEVTVFSPKGGKAPVDLRSASKPEEQELWKQVAHVIDTTRPLTSAIHAADYDAIFIPGGHGPLFDLAIDPQTARVISEFARAGKPVASVCHGPASLLGATLADGTPFVRGKKLTAFSDAEEKAVKLDALVPFSVEQRLKALGAVYTQGPDFAAYALTDGNLITGQNPASSAKVAALLIAQLQGTRTGE